jgi:predicted DNA-binding antitoxin AbrB/MazE fold protein
MLWNRGDDAGKDQARKQKRRLLYISNVYIVNDPSNPENNGQVKLFRYGKKIFDKLNEAMNPQFEDEKPLNPFDFWEGANFKIKIRNLEGYRNYDKSEFEKPGKLDEDDSKVEQVWASQYSLNEFIDPSNFKTYQELEAKLNKVLMTSSSDVTAEDVELAPEPTPSVTPPKESVAPAPEEDDADMDMFKKMLND